jgi:hypothetical protein
MSAAVVFEDSVDEIPEVRNGGDEGQEQWDVLRRRLAFHPATRKFHITELCQEYEELTGTCTGCD